MLLVKDIIMCSNLIVSTSKFCHHCGHTVEINISPPLFRTCTSFNDLDFNIIKVIAQHVHSKYQPLKHYYAGYNDKVRYNSENELLCLLFSLNRHYRRHKAKNYSFRLNKVYSLK